MKKLLVTFLLAASMIAAQPLTGSERDRALSHLHATRKMFLDSISGLSEAQWRFKSAADSWSVAEVAEHIALSEEFFAELVHTKAMGSPIAKQHRTAAQAAKDAEILEMYQDRSRRFDAPEYLRPRGKWAGRNQLAEDFRAARDRMIAFVRESNAELRSHFAPHPAMERLDAYQWILAMSTHTERHVAQIRAVRANENFPAN